MEKTNYILLNDSFVKSTVDELKMSINDRAFQFGDGVYEVVRIYNGKLHLLNGHMERLYRSLKLIDLTIDFTEEQFKAKLEELVDKNEFEGDGIIYLHVSRGVSARQHHFPVDVDPTIIAYVKPLERPLEEMEEGASALLFPDNRWLQCNIKSLNLLANAQAKQRATEAKHLEAIFYREPMISDINPLEAAPTSSAFITEGSSSNLFMIKNEIIHTHPANHLILNGIVRQRVIELANRLNYEVEEKPFTVSELMEADEVFVTSTTKEIVPITSLHDLRGNKKAFKHGGMTRRLQDAFSEDIKRLNTITVK